MAEPASWQMILVLLRLLLWSVAYQIHNPMIHDMIVWILLNRACWLAPRMDCVRQPEWVYKDRISLDMSCNVLFSPSHSREEPPTPATRRIPILWYSANPMRQGVASGTIVPWIHCVQEPDWVHKDQTSLKMSCNVPPSPSRHHVKVGSSSMWWVEDHKKDYHLSQNKIIVILETMLRQGRRV